MPDQSRPSEAVFLRMVNERYGEFRDRLREFVAVFGATNQQDKTERASRVLAAATALSNALAGADRPPWLEPIRIAVQKFIANPSNPTCLAEVSEAIGTHYGAAINHSWAFISSDDGAFDFDGLYAQHESQSRIPELFDRLTELLEKIVQCEELDSRKAIHTLETIIATLKKNRQGSFFSLICTWDFTALFIKNVAWELLSQVPGLGAVVKAVRDTMSEINTAMDKLHNDVATDLHRRLAVEFPALEYRPLPLPEPLALTDETGIIDVEVGQLENHKEAG